MITDPDPLELLDDAPTGPDPSWARRVATSLVTQPDDWVTAATCGGLGVDRSWALLGWVEGEASALVRARDAEVLEHAAFALALLEASPLDVRDRQVVGALVRRGARLALVDFEAGVERGTGAAGDLGIRCRAWLDRVDTETPATHEETGQGPTFAFARRRDQVDVDRLRAWLGE